MCGYRVSRFGRSLACRRLSNRVTVNTGERDNKRKGLAFRYLTFVYGGHRCNDFCYSWQKMERDFSSQLSKNLPSWASVPCITSEPSSPIRKRFEILLQGYVFGTGLRRKCQMWICATKPSRSSIGFGSKVEPNSRFASANCQHVCGVPAKVAMEKA